MSKNELNFAFYIIFFREWTIQIGSGFTFTNDFHFIFEKVSLIWQYLYSFSSNHISNSKFHCRINDLLMTLNNLLLLKLALLNLNQ